MTSTELMRLRPNRLFAIPSSDSKHRRWKHGKQYSYLDYQWDDIPVVGFENKRSITISVAQYYQHYEKEKIKNIADGIYQFSRLHAGDGIISFNENSIENIGIISANPELDLGQVHIRISWAEDFIPTSNRTSLINKSAVEILKVNDRLLKQLKLPSVLFKNVYRSTMSFNKNIDEETYISARQTEPKKDPGGNITLFYGTNRNKTNKNDANNYYGGELDSLKVGICTVSIPAGHKQGEMERPRKILLWQLNENESKHIILTGINEFSEKIFHDWLNEENSKNDSKAALIFIHGYNTAFSEAAWRTGQIAHDIPFNGLAGFFSWPSTGATLDYGRDIERADASIPDFIKFIEGIISKTEIEHLHFIAHSMGNRVLTYALNKLAMMPHLINKIKTIKQIILAAPDIDKDVFDKSILPEFQAIGDRRTLYASDKDKALKLSKRLRSDLIRIGEAGERLYITDSLDTIDASNVASEGNHHSYMFEVNELLYDLYMLLDKGLEPSERRLREVNKEEKKYWLFRE